MHILTADIGGTHSRFAVFDIQQNSTKLITTSKFENSQFESLEHVLQTFLTENHLQIDSACLAVAAPVPNADISFQLTNLNWNIAASTLKSKFQLKHCFIINDFAAIAYGVDSLTHQDFYTIRSGQTPKQNGPVIIIGPGTGLGVSLVIKNQANTIRVLTTEAGHSSIAPESAQHFALLNFLNKNHYSTIWERVLSGSGLQLLYQFIANTNQAPAAELINTTGINNQESTEYRVLLLFIELLGLFTKNIALITLPTKVLFCGSILLQLFPGLGQGVASRLFCHTVSNHSTHHQLLEQAAISLITKTDIALNGALAFYQQTLKINE